MTEPLTDSYPPITQLTRAQRRVLGVLLEKGFTTPEYYPLTLKAATTGCNQKSNRDPVVTYDEDRVEQVMDELQAIGLVAIVHTDTGRSARYRHYARRRFTLSEAQLAILTELLLRGRQTLGELRTRASRMVPIDSLDDLRSELGGLFDLKLLQTNGPLDRRGVEVDHGLYTDQEQQAISAALMNSAVPASPHVMMREEQRSQPMASSAGGAPISHASDDRIRLLEQTCESLQAENAQLKESMETLSADFSQLRDDFENLRRALGG